MLCNTLGGIAVDRSNTNRRYLYIRWFLLRFSLVIYDIFAVNFAYYLALLVRFYVNYEFNIWAVRYVPAFFQFAPFYTCFSALLRSTGSPLCYP